MKRKKFIVRVLFTIEGPEQATVRSVERDMLVRFEEVLKVADASWWRVSGDLIIEADPMNSK